MMIAAAAEANNGDYECAMEWFGRARVLPNSDGLEGTGGRGAWDLWVASLSACSHFGRAEQAMVLWTALNALNVDADSFVMASLVDALARKGHFVRALAVLTEFERCCVAVDGAAEWVGEVQEFGGDCASAAVRLRARQIAQATYDGAKCVRLRIWP